MIKQLITDLSHDNITLSQALTRSKIIAYKLKNNTFRNWIKKETDGYDFDDPMLPSYRKIFSEMYLIAKFSGGEETKFPFNPPENSSKEVLDTIKFHQIREPIQIVELQINNEDEPKNGRIKLPMGMLEMAKSTLPKPILMQIQMVGGVIDTLEREVHSVNLHNVINQTKNILLDTLLELETQFPDLENDYEMNEENEKKANNIITTNIYGNNTPVNIATGDNVNQNNELKIETVDFEKLKSLKIEDSEIQELKEIIASSNGDKKTFASKAIGWLGKVTTSLTARGLYDNIPQIAEYIQSLC
ncbi:hypothetical protein [Corallibacter sp.]|uniref:AbiTii domain-containing protein n=1 Tax=Corallibacter sp. TaxID=2038084 RepID=UPI003AB4A579